MVPDDKYPVFNSAKQITDTVWNIIENNKEVNAETIASNLRDLLWFSSPSKIDFAKLSA